MKKIVYTPDLSYEEWLEWRTKGIGGSDASSIAGLNPWKSAFSVYMDKIGEGIEVQDNERMRIGRDLEDYVAKRFEEATGLKVRRNNFMLQHDEHEFMIANIDREIVGENAFLECKTTNSYSAKDWEDGKVPIHYELQCLHYMAVCGFDYGYIAVLIGNQYFKYKKIMRDEETIQNLIAIEKDFWENNVLKREVPSPDGSDCYSEMLKEKYKNVEDEEIDLSNLEDKTNKYLEIKGLIKDLESEAKLIEQQVQSEMKTSNRAISGENLITWNEYSSTRLNTKEFKKDYPELFDKYSTTKNIRRFQIK